MSNLLWKSTYWRLVLSIINQMNTYIIHTISIISWLFSLQLKLINVENYNRYWKFNCQLTLFFLGRVFIANSISAFTSRLGKIEWNWTHNKMMKVNIYLFIMMILIGAVNNVKSLYCINFDFLCRIFNKILIIYKF